jgi:glyceraldehyde 3-phosphate dehydrogenase
MGNERLLIAEEALERNDSMPVRVAINGFGRIGRSVFRAGLEKAGIDFVAINDVADTATLAHLLKHDSLRGKLAREVKVREKALFIDGKEIATFSSDRPEALPWKELAVDIVLESTGKFTFRDKAEKHIDAGTKKVIISAPAHDPDVTVIPGINGSVYRKDRHHIISMGSCTANCLAPVAAVLDGEFGIINGHMTTVHGYTNDQALQDEPHRDLRRGRAALLSIIPTTTTAVYALGLIIPRLQGRIEGISIRVPTPNVALIDFVATLARGTTTEEVNQVFSRYAAGPMRELLCCSPEAMVSCDFSGNPYPSVVDLTSTQVIGGNMVKVLAWYDNEWGFSKRVCELFAFLMT